MSTNGISNLYVSFVSDMISQHETNGTIQEISRSDIELQLLTEIDRGDLPIEWKLSWFQAVIATPIFDAIWSMTKHKHLLSDTCTQRYVPDPSLQTYAVPSNYRPPPSIPSPIQSPAPTTRTTTRTTKRTTTTAPRNARNTIHPTPTLTQSPTFPDENPYAKPKGRSYRNPRSSTPSSLPHDQPNHGKLDRSVKFALPPPTVVAAGPATPLATPTRTASGASSSESDFFDAEARAFAAKLGQPSTAPRWNDDSWEMENAADSDGGEGSEQGIEQGEEGGNEEEEEGEGEEGEYHPAAEGDGEDADRDEDEDEGRSPLVGRGRVVGFQADEDVNMGGVGGVEIDMMGREEGRILDAQGLRRQSGDDGAWGSSPAKGRKKVKGKSTPRKTVLKGRGTPK